MVQVIAYSYVRFSSEKQQQGHSLERQLALAEAYAKQHSLALDTSSFRDLGVSAFKSKNKDEGALSAFLDAIRAGTVRPGSFLLVENFDRLSRDTVPVALELFLSITRAGITIVTLQDGRAYSQESIQANWVDLVVALSQMAAANAESQKKSERVRAAWEAKKKSGKPITRMAPAWLRLVDDGWVVLEDKASTVRRIFQLAHDGLGAPRIAKALNEVLTPTMGSARAWTFALVAAILHHKAVIGTLRSKDEEVPNYYPPIIDEALFWEVQQRVKSRQWKGGRNADNVRNLFSGMTYCARCGATMRSVGSSSKHTYLQCLSSYSRSGCTAKRFAYYPAEQQLMAFWANSQGRLLWSESKVQANPKVELDAERTAIEKKISNLLSALEVGSSKALATRLIELEERLEVVKAKLAEPEPSLSPEAVQEASELFRRFHRVMESGTDDERRELRFKVQATIRRFLTRIEVDGSRVVLHYASGKVREREIEQAQVGFQPGNRNGRNQ